MVWLCQKSLFGGDRDAEELVSRSPAAACHLAHRSVWLTHKTGRLKRAENGGNVPKELLWTEPQQLDAAT
jgi:hypothetical protein